MSRFVFPIVLFCLVCVAGGAAHAQSRQYDRSYIANPKYEFMVQQAERFRSENFRFSQFRVFYTQTRQYDPIGDKTLKNLQDFAFVVLNGEDPDAVAVQEALEGYSTLLKAHLAHLRIVAQALAFSKIDARLGDPGFLAWVRDGLVRDVVESGDGKSLQGAYDIITMDEETALFLELGLKSLKTQSVREGYIYYNMHDVEDLRTGRVSTLFVNTTYALQFLEGERVLPKNVFSIRRQ